MSSPYQTHMRTMVLVFLDQHLPLSKITKNHPVLWVKIPAPWVAYGKVGNQSSPCLEHGMSTVRWRFFFFVTTSRTMSKKHPKSMWRLQPKYELKWSWSNHSQIWTHMKTPENYHPSKRYVSTTRSIELQLPRKLKAAPVNRAPQVRKPWNFLWNMMGSCKKYLKLIPWL